MNADQRSFGEVGDRPEREAVVVGYGLEYLVMAINCGRSIRASNPGLLTTLVTNVAVDAQALGDSFDRVVVRDEPADLNRHVKTSILEFTVAEKVLYVDADSEVVGDLTPFFRLLDRFDVILRLQAVPVNKPFELADGIPGGAFPHYHGGAFLLRDGVEARAFLEHWQRRMFESGLSRDQPALARTVYDLPGLHLLVVNAVLCADDFETRALFKPKHETPRIAHFGDPHGRPATARRLLDIAVRMAAVLVEQGPHAAELERVRKKYRQMNHPLFRIRWTRSIYLRAALRSAGGDVAADPRRRTQSVRGRPYVGDGGRLWDDHA